MLEKRLHQAPLGRCGNTNSVDSREQRRGRTGSLFPRYPWLLVLMGLVQFGMSPVRADDARIALTIPLEQGRWYSRQAVQEECHRQLGTPLPSEMEEDRRIELTVAEKAALLLANEAGVLDVRFEPDRLTIWIPNAEDDGVRREHRHRLERLFGISLPDWPEEKGLHVPERFDPKKRTALLVHGLEGNLNGLERLADACEATGFQILQFDYPNTGPIAWSGDRLCQELSTFALEHPTAHLVVIAHSMGGLVVRHCLESPECDLSCVTDVVFLGTPHQGSFLAGESDLLELFDRPVFSKEEFARKLNEGLGEARMDLQPGSLFLRTLNAQPRPQNVRYHVGLGTKSFVTADQAEEITQVLQRRLAAPDLPSALRARWQQVRDAPEWVPGQGDGAVSASSAHLPGADHERTFALNHLELKDLPGAKPEESAVFQWILDVIPGRILEKP